MIARYKTRRCQKCGAKGITGIVKTIYLCSRCYWETTKGGLRNKKWENSLMIQ
tara:strand:+ start:246 stop:404 length:159 start_codon:yes stop_codon:yes gene_type:complete